MSRILSIAVVSILTTISAAQVFARDVNFDDRGLAPAEEIDRQNVRRNDLHLDIYDRASREREARDCRRRGDCYPPPRRPMPPPRRPIPPRGYGYVCYAENEYRQIYEGRDRVSARFAQAEAMDTCSAYSRRCYPLGCDSY